MATLGELNQAHKDGFSLVEALMAVTILGILSAIALPNYMNSIKSSRQSDVANQISQILTTIQAYREEFLTDPSSWDDLARITPVPTNSGAAKGSGFTAIASPNGGYYNISITPGTTTNITASPAINSQNGWAISACLNTQSGISGIERSSPGSTAKTPNCS